jgi:hypothetical protein
MWPNMVACLRYWWTNHLLISGPAQVRVGGQGQGDAWSRSGIGYLWPWGTVLLYSGIGGTVFSMFIWDQCQG